MGRKRDPFEEAEEKGTKLEDFVIPQKARAFSEAYVQVEDCRMATVVFDEAKLRDFFNATPCALGDPLSIYIGILELRGFNLRVGIGNKPAIYVRERNISSIISKMEA